MPDIGGNCNPFCSRLVLITHPSYTSQWNLLDYPSLVFPVTTVDQEKDQAETGYQPRNEKDQFNYKLCGSKVDTIQRFELTREDSPERYTDAPVSLQLVGRRYEDEKVGPYLELRIYALLTPSAGF